MSADGTRWLPRLLGVLLLLMGMALVAGGIKLMQLGGSLYYLIAGIGFAVSGIMLLALRKHALGLYGLVLLGSTAWALWEVGLDWWQLVPRLSLWFALGVVLLLPWARRPLRGLAGQPARVNLAVLGVAVVASGATAIASQFTHPGEIKGELGRDTTTLFSTAPDMPDGDWQAYGRTEYGDRYSPLRQITPSNIYQLEEAWRIRTGDLPSADDPVELTNQNTPLKVNGMLYACTAHSKVLALDPDTGAEIWRFDPQIKSPSGSFKGFAHMTCRGVSYYDENNYVNADGSPAPKISEAGQAVARACPRRLYLPTADARLIVLNADNGKVCEGFANNGTIDLTQGIGPFTAGGYYSTSPAAITRSLVIIGGHVTDNESTNEPSGVIRAYDVHDGRLVWNWDSNNPDDTKPLAPGKTYSRNSANMWSLASVDENLGMVYLPLGNQTPDQWGADRTPGAEKFSAGIVALDLATGKVRWNYQFTHHDLWDMDVGSQPTLLDLKTADGVKPALIAPTKQGSLYVLDRRDGTAIVPIREIPVPQGAVPGDHTSPTQARSDLNLLGPDLTEQAMWGASPFDQMLCRIQFRELRYEGQYTPPSVQGSLVYPGNVGVFNWGSVSVDPVRQLLFTSPNYMAFVSKMVPRAEVAEGSKRESETSGVQPNTGAPYAVTMHPFMSPLGVPCQAPAWGYVAGIDLLSNKVVWKHKNGTSRDSSPIPIGLPIGVPSMGGSIVTASGLGFLSGTLDQYLRAYDVNTGKELWKSRLPAGGQATPMTYTGKDGKQYVLVTAGGHGSLGTRMGDYIIAYKLPN
ncbi:glucose/quinate/shikimate family membrane-bound PQQ-dependent dehydrogenase [Pseudomonas putida CSV86]|uniref:Glucose/quinate/shikimate family membrane-bound PQQ-dependent dehydrogenase n=1 Tax=Pseudomonas bharatica CSV86 TaxID=1005395 RepID=L1M0F2_9PSED|nr:MULTISPECIES: glucose/quinate/shikimate family membrane-bound PQQ-dependent dehydrogenase [Pseudomonas]MDG9884990.1 glucose/quinate/shikimate family membrane-bound PQQ-dependent dehydrogenase [Pseudomonas sp. GD04058]NNJ14118.1 glucose/quinate/shikimate family membrane-bound PQQ-dependent dehydrogenase [Pseudomonas bharatica CSV86]